MATTIAVLIASGVLLYQYAKIDRLEAEIRRLRGDPPPAKPAPKKAKEEFIVDVPPGYRED